MTVKNVLLLHGIASSSRSYKASYLREQFKNRPEFAFHTIDFNPTLDDFQNMTITGLINRLRQFVLDRELESLSLIGSSLGALTGMNYGHRFGGVDRLLLLAPALCYAPDVTEEEARHWERTGTLKTYHYAFQEEVTLGYDMHLDGLRYQDPVPPPAPVKIIHGRLDKVVPIEDSRAYAARYPEQVRLVEVGSDHRLNDQLELIWEYLLRWLSEPSA